MILRKRFESLGVFVVIAVLLHLVSGSVLASHKNQNRSHIANGKESGFFYITNAIMNNLSKVDVTTHKVIKSLRVGKRPLGVATTPDERYALVSNFDSNNVSVVDLSIFKIMKNIKVGTAPDGIAVSPSGRSDSPRWSAARLQRAKSSSTESSARRAWFECDCDRSRAIRPALAWLTSATGSPFRRSVSR